MVMEKNTRTNKRLTKDLVASNQSLCAGEDVGDMGGGVNLSFVYTFIAKSAY